LDIGEYDISSAATPGVMSLTSLASGALLRFEVTNPGDAGVLGVSLHAKER